jgi:hypothetical protein
MKSKIVLLLAIPIAIACNSGSDSKTEAAAVDATASPAAPDTLELLPSSSTAMARQALEAYAAGNMDAFVENLAEDVRLYHPAPGDSLIGRQAVKDYFTARRATADSITLVNPVMLGLRNNLSSNVPPGDWLFSWYTYRIKYKTGKSANIPIHIAQHVNASGKSDLMYMYYDVHRIMEASK